MTQKQTATIIPFDENINTHIPFNTRQKCSGNKQQQVEPFYRLYKFLLFDPQYKGLHVKSKAMFTLIIDAMIYRINKATIKVDRNGYQYIEFETEYFKKMLKISVNAVTKFKKELIKVGLIDVTSKTGKQRLYVYMPKIEDKKFYYYNKETKSNKYTYIELPKFLFEAAYQSMPVEAAFIYSILRDNQYLSIKNSRTTGRFVDNHGDVYTKYTYDRFIDALNIKSKHTIKKHINTLVKHKLLIVSNVGTTINHIFRTQNRYYVLEPKKANNNIIKQADTNDTYVSNKGINVEQNEANNGAVEVHNHNNNSSDSHNMLSSNIKNSSNTKNINAQYISESDSLKSENELLREQIRYYKKYIKQYLPDFIDEEKTLKEQLLQNFPAYLRTLIANYTTSVKETQRAMSVICGANNKYNQLYGTNYRLEDLENEIGEVLIRVNRKHKKDNKTIAEVCNYLFTSIKCVFTQRHEEDYNKGFFANSPEMTLFGDLPNVMIAPIKSMNSKMDKEISVDDLHAANQYATDMAMPY